MVDHIIEQLQKYSSQKRAEKNQYFFKTGKGEYSEGDKFLGVSVPDCRKVIKQFYHEVSLADTFELLTNEWHEVRLTAIFILVQKYQAKRSSLELKKNIISGYLEHLEYVNNWDLVDSSAYKLLGDYLYNHKKDCSVLYELAKTKELWKERVAMIATLYFIKQGDFKDCLKLAKHFLNHEHDLMHKASGWMLREMGKMNVQPLYKFLDKNASKMPRTMLRYAVEKLDKKERQHYMNL